MSTSYGMGEIYLLYKQRLYLIALVSAAMILMLVSIAGATQYAYITNNKTNMVSVPGIFVYNPASGIMLNIGLNQPLTAYFTPNDTANYTTASAKVSINVMKLAVAYITNSWDNTVSVINTTTNTVIATIPVGNFPYGATVTPDGTKVYVTNYNGNTVSVINTATNNVTATVNVGSHPMGVAVTPDATKVYVTNEFSNTVSVINTTTNQVTSNVSVGINPLGIAVSLDGTKVYVTNYNGNTVSVINTATNNVTVTVPVGNNPVGVAVTPDGTKVYVANSNSNNISVINTANNTVTTSVPAGSSPYGAIVTPDGTKVYVTNYNGNTVSAINTATNKVTATVPVGTSPYGVAVTPDGSNVYVANSKSNGVSVINTTTNTVIATVPVEYWSIAFGKFIGDRTVPTITWSNPTNIAYGTALSSTQLDAIASDPMSGLTVPGIFVYTPSSGTRLNVGLNQTLTAYFTPTDTANYTTASANISINVINTTLVTPTITWSNPTNIVYGTALSSTQLDAIALDPMSGLTVPGIFVYTPPSGTRLNVGLNQTLTAYFTPTDTANYTTVSANVSINVMKLSVAYITNCWNNTVSVINTTTNTVTATIPVGNFPWGISVTSDGTKVYVTNNNGNNLTNNSLNINTVSVIDTATNNVTATVPVGSNTVGIAVTPDGTKV